ncbi:MAG: cobalamin-independent methionine synthase II family protein [Chloroflexi bacterium]|nr:cobalamin-independent methionine synthase II family protein [Chloroflexota bacterium]MYA49264.1 cobalamin-independent methionine synthase II family protein [Chloroflexota bacterium]MYB84380.1 cobalamin-independent methionine synthase II family protein [Chloroflexota bacterium]MYK35765.1 cobalamin-independent methionine synthase II family protein [Chloroflexota bacterium]
MKLSTDRILTTHVGSLPRPDDVAALLLKKEREEEYDAEELETLVRQGVADIVARQHAAGVDIVSDGEMSKVAYSTYAKDRLTGFEGDSPRRPNLDVAPYPDFRAKMARMTGDQPMRRPQCVGPVEVKDREPLQKDLENFRAALEGAGVADAFMTSSSPGVASVFMPNAWYPTHEAYVDALGAAMKEEYEAIVGAGFVLQVDCPDLAMAFHTGFQGLTEEEFLHRAEHHIDVLNGALENVPAESVRMHVCWGNYEGPHDYDIAVSKIIPIVLRAKPSAILFEASNPRHAHEWKDWRDADIPDDKVLAPGVLDSTSNFVEHPELVAQRIETFAAIVGRERVLAGSDCGFGTFAGYGKMDPDIIFRKLESLAEGAAIASERLWG